MRRAQVNDASDTRPFHVDAKGRGGQTTDHWRGKTEAKRFPPLLSGDPPITK